MKKAVLWVVGIVIVGLVLFYVLNGFNFVNEKSESTLSEIHVVKKCHNEDETKAWIIAYNPNDSHKKKLKIIIEDHMVYNLIDVNKNYSADYTKVGNKPWILDYIAQNKVEDAIR